MAYERLVADTIDRFRDFSFPIAARRKSGVIFSLGTNPLWHFPAATR